MPHALVVSRVLESLTPQDQEELNILRWVVECAQRIRLQSDMELGPVRGAVTVSNLQGTREDLQRFTELVAPEAKRYLHGLIEALGVYQLIHGCSPVPATLSLRDGTVEELKQLRDFCLEDGIRSIY